MKTQSKVFRLFIYLGASANLGKHGFTHSGTAIALTPAEAQHVHDDKQFIDTGEFAESQEESYTAEQVQERWPELLNKQGEEAVAGDESDTAGDPATETEDTPAEQPAAKHAASSHPKHQKGPGKHHKRRR